MKSFLAVAVSVLALTGCTGGGGSGSGSSGGNGSSTNQIKLIELGDESLVDDIVITGKPEVGQSLIVSIESYGENDFDGDTSTKIAPYIIGNCRFNSVKIRHTVANVKVEDGKYHYKIIEEILEKVFTEDSTDKDKIKCGKKLDMVKVREESVSTDYREIKAFYEYFLTRELHRLSADLLNTEFKTTTNSSSTSYDLQSNIVLKEVETPIGTYDSVRSIYTANVKIVSSQKPMVSKSSMEVGSNNIYPWISLYGFRTSTLHTYYGDQDILKTFEEEVFTPQVNVDIDKYLEKLKKIEVDSELDEIRNLRTQELIKI